MGFEYRSRRSVFGLPLIHVALGSDPYTGKRHVAKGVIAIGQVAVGGIAVGQVAVGGIAIGQLAAGLGFGLGQLAFACAALGQFAAGGGWSLGQVAAGPGADGSVVWASTWSLAALVGAWLITACSLSAVARRLRRGVARLLPALRPAIVDARPGEAILSGKVVAVKTLEAPVSHRACVAYDVRKLAENRVPRDERRVEDFVIEDATGRARVVTSDCEMLLDGRRRVTRAVQKVSMAHLKVSNSTYPVRAQTEARVPETRLERILCPGDHVTVAGNVTRGLGGGSSGAVQVVVHASGRGPVLITNRDVDELRAETSINFWLAALMVVATVATLVVQL